MSEDFEDKKVGGIEDDDIVDDDTSAKKPDDDDDDDDGESVGFSFGRVTAAKKEEELRFLPFLNVPDTVDESEDEEEDDSGEAFSLSFGKVSAAKKERDYVYMPFLDSDDSAESDEEEQKDGKSSYDDDDDSGIDIVGGEELINTAPLRRSSTKKTQDTKTQSSDRSKRAPQQQKKTKKGKSAPQQKRPGQKTLGHKPNKVQQIIASMDPDIIAAVSSDPRQLMMLEETVRTELIKQSAQAAVARELNTGDYAAAPARPNNPPKRNNGRPPQRQGGSSVSGVRGYNLMDDSRGRQRGSGMTAPTADTISEFGSEPAMSRSATKPLQIDYNQDSSQPVQTIPAQSPVEQVPVTAPAQTAVPQQSTPAAAKQPYNPTSPAAIRAAMKAGIIPVDTPTVQTAEKSDSSAPKPIKRSAAERKRSEKRSGCVMGAIALIMVTFVAVILIIRLGDINSQIRSKEVYDQAYSLYEKGQYELAIELLSDITYAKKDALILDCYYAWGKQAEASGDYETAAEYYNIAGTTEAIRSYVDIMLETAQKKSNSGDYYSAYNTYRTVISRINECEDTSFLKRNELEEIQALADEATYNYAKDEYSNGNYANAQGFFSLLIGNANYTDASNWYNNSKYNNAMQCYRNADYETAVSELEYFVNDQIYLDLYPEAEPYYATAHHYYFTQLYSEGADVTLDQWSMTLKLLEKSVSDPIAGDLEIEKLMMNDTYDATRLIGEWSNLDGYYIVFSQSGSIEFYFPNEAAGENMQSLEATEMILQDNSMYVICEGIQYQLINDLTYNTDLSSAPSSLTFLNLYDGQVYTLFRRR